MTQDTTRGISGIRLRNIGKFEAFSLQLRDGEIVEIQGDNDEGKSTIPLAVEAALFGKLEDKTGPNHGTPDGRGDLMVTLNGYEITRVVEFDKHGEPKTRSLEVLDAQGMRPYDGDAAQTWLTRMFGQKGSFLNPFKLMDLPRKEQISAIVRALPIDLAYATDRVRAISDHDFDGEFTDAEGVFSTIRRYDENYRKDRLEAGKRLKTAEAAFRASSEALPQGYDENCPPPNPPAAMQDLYDQRAAIERTNQRREMIGRQLAHNEQEIRRLEEQLAGLRNQGETLATELLQLGRAQDTADLDARITDHKRAMQEYQRALETHGDLKRRRVERDEAFDRAERLREDHGKLDGQVKALAALPAELFARTELPIPGMFIQDDEIMLPHPETGELRPAEEFGDAALLDLYIALAMQLAPIPVILADGLERCGPKRSQEIYDRIQAKGFQLIGTRVTEGPLKVVRINATVGGESTTIDAEMPEDEQEFDFEIPEL